MKTTFEFENDEIIYFVKDSIGVLKFKANSFVCFSDLDKSGQIIGLTEWVERDPVVKALLILNDPAAFDDTAYENFMNSIFDTDNIDHSKKIIDPAKKLARARQMNSFRNFLMKMVDFKKLFVAGLDGCIVTPIFGLSLSADFRFASENMFYSLAHIKYGLHPSGALPFFLEKHLSIAKTNEILFAMQTVPAEKALQWELVGEVFPFSEFENNCIERTKQLSQMDLNVMRLTKRLTYNFKEELEHYFAVESKLIGY